MSLVVEDGSGLVDAESYASVADSDAYWSERGGDAWSAASTAAKEAALRKATEYIDATYSWRGLRSSQAQGLSWPRYDALDDDGYSVTGIPAVVIKATMLLALSALSGDLLPHTTTSPVKRTKSKVGEIETETEYAVDEAGAPLRYGMVDSMLAGLVESQAGAGVRSIRMVRS